MIQAQRPTAIIPKYVGQCHRYRPEEETLPIQIIIIDAYVTLGLVIMAD